MVEMTIQKDSIHERMQKREYLRSIGCHGWFGYASVTPPVIPTNHLCIRCNHKRSGCYGTLCLHCRHKIHEVHPVGGLSSPDSFELAELQGGNHVHRMRTKAVSRGRDPLSADIIYHGD